MGKTRRRTAEGPGREADSLVAYEKAVSQTGEETYVLRLYVTGMTPRSQRAIENLRQLCREHLGERFELEIVDIYQQPSLAKDEQIIAAPTLIKKLPPPLRKIIGDLSDPGRVLLALGLKKDIE